jgi:hypothetical protein
MKGTAILAGFLAAAAGAMPAHAAPERYDYRVIHPSYGDIGTYTNIVDRVGDDTEVTSELRIIVRMLGIVVYRQEARRTEQWHGDRLVRFDGVTVTNGDRLPVHGEARDGVFVVTTPAGTVRAPSNVHPSNPWSPMVLDTNLMMSTRTGQVESVRVRGGEIEPVALPGATLRLHQYEVVSDKRQFVWLDDSGTPVAFRTVEKGTPVDFVLTRRQELASGER